jgi:hypothetical protein
VVLVLSFPCLEADNPMCSGLMKAPPWRSGTQTWTNAWTELGYRGLSGSVHIGNDAMNSSKPFDENTFAPGTLVRWRTDGETGFIVECWKTLSDIHDTVSIRFYWVSSFETVEIFDDMRDVNRCFIVLSEPTYNRDASKYTDSELPE